MCPLSFSARTLTRTLPTLTPSSTPSLTPSPYPPSLRADRQGRSHPHPTPHPCAQIDKDGSGKIDLPELKAAIEPSGTTRRAAAGAWGDTAPRPKFSQWQSRQKLTRPPPAPFAPAPAAAGTLAASRAVAATLGSSRTAPSLLPVKRGASEAGGGMGGGGMGGGGMGGAGMGGGGMGGGAPHIRPHIRQTRSSAEVAPAAPSPGACARAARALSVSSQAHPPLPSQAHPSLPMSHAHDEYDADEGDDDAATPLTRPFSSHTLNRPLGENQLADLAVSRSASSPRPHTAMSVMRSPAAIRPHDRAIGSGGGGGGGGGAVGACGACGAPAGGLYASRSTPALTAVGGGGGGQTASLPELMSMPSPCGTPHSIDTSFAMRPLLQPIHPTGPTMRLGVRKPPRSAGPQHVGLRLLAGKTAWPSDLASDLDWFCSVATLAPPPPQGRAAAG
jgi:hypothetical protein